MDVTIVIVQLQMGATETESFVKLISGTFINDGKQTDYSLQMKSWAAELVAPISNALGF